MSEADRAWITLANAHVRVSEYFALADRFGDAEAITRQSAAELQDAGLAAHKSKAITQPDIAQIDRELDWLDAANHHLVTCHGDACPNLLRQIPAPPLLLYVHGDAERLHLPALAIVGSRNPTQAGSRNAFEFAHHLGSNGFTIVSGLAQGIDTAAHRGAIGAGAGTIAFLGHGIDRVYPASNRELAHEIATDGALVTEYPLGTHPDKRHFPERNRLISGLCLGTLVVEAARRSGSLITARLAAEQGREVFALPGSIHNPLARGCHTLIKQGAKLVETADDIVAELAPLTGRVLQITVESRPNEPIEEGKDDEYSALRRILGHDPISADELAEQSGLTIDRVSSMLLILELHGEVESLSGGRYSLLS
ncbi:MAG: DNA-processing protein DprA [Gammaproteobacteria bacterium]|nr:DNA-processing protein DprA [Gammaproteobacteria bacterium]